MWCPACAWLIDASLNKLPGVLRSGCNFSTDRLRCVYDPVLTSPDRIIAFIERLGYHPALPGEGGRAKEKRRETIRFAVSTFLTMNVMMMSFALYSGFFSLWREDFERINGFDEEFTGWGCEDDDLGLRLRRSGVKTASIMDSTLSFHLWHPWHPSRVPRWRDGANVDYLERPVRLTRCLHGLQNRDLRDLMIGVVGRPSDRSMATSLLKNLPRPVVDLQDAEVEILFRPGDGRFSGRADCNVLVVTRESAGIRRPARNAHLVFADHSWRGVPAGKTHRLQRLGRLLKLIEGQSSRGSPLP